MIQYLSESGGEIAETLTAVKSQALNLKKLRNELVLMGQVVLRESQEVQASIHG